MKPTKSNTNKVATKGARKQWEPLSAVQPVTLSQYVTKGSVVSVKANVNGNFHLLLP